MVKRNEDFGERRSKLWRVIGTKSPFLKENKLAREIKTQTPQASRRSFRKALTAQREGKDYMAEEAYKQSIERGASPAAHHNYAILLDTLARYREADEHFSKAHSLDPRESLILENYVDFLIHVDFMEKAERYVTKWVEAHPKDAKAWLKYALILAFQGNFKEAEAKFSRYETCVDEATSIPNHPFKEQARMKFAIRLAFLGSPLAKKFLDPLMRNGRSYPQVRGMILTLLGDYEEAERCFKERMRNYPVNPDVRVAFTSLLERQGKIGEAKRILEESLGELPEDATTFSHMANIFLLTGKDEKALNFHKKAITKEPYNALVHFSYAQFLVRHQEEKANEHFLRSLEIAPRAPEIHLAYGNYLTGVGRDEDAARHLKRAAELNPQDSLVHLSLAHFFKLRGKWSKSERHKRKAYRLNAEVVRDHWWL